ncbi:tRNA epoxyqueuosine(34) reductase QueG [Mycoplasmatota bacterium]|nr:tRNA epoxyqueuosine(34) reductase QueG [Mycoplasmatota bacterium]
MKAIDLKEMIENRFPCQVGFVKARIFDELKENLEKYQEINHDLQLLENNIDKRINPYLIDKDVKTIIVVIFPYQSHAKEIENQSHVVSRSSWGIDYHLVIKDKLNEIKQMIDTKKWVVLTDNHPLHERHIAYLAGLGNYGKNTLLINPKYGSYFFISLILTDLELNDYEYNKPVYEDICKNCNRCLKACPTQAISEDRFINAKRCMSYLTQSKTEIPIKFLKKFTKFSFGCDFCQISCVYNSNVDLPVLSEFKPSGREIIQVKDLENLSNRRFNEEYKTLSASFRGKNVLLRNAILVSANSKNKEDLKNIDHINVNQNNYLKQAIDYAKDILNKGEE